MADRIPVGPKRAVHEAPGFADRYLLALRDNPNLPECCRQVEDHTFQLFKSREGAPGPDVLVVECACGRRHTRVAAGAS